MRILVIVVLFVFFAYSLGLVILNDSEMAVNLLFYKAPEMNLGLLLIVCILLGFFIGVLSSILIFKVLQNLLEIRKLKKKVTSLETKLDKANTDLENQMNQIADEAKSIAESSVPAEVEASEVK